MSSLPPLVEDNQSNNRRKGKVSTAVRDPSIINLQGNTLLSNSVAPTRSIDDKLAEQFRYFRHEFMEAAINSGATIPLDMVEDKNGHLYTFVKTNGPKYIFQIMQNNIKSVHLLRCSLSLIIITITLLRRKCVEATKSKPLHGTGRNLLSHVNSATSQSAISAWAIESLAKIVDSGTVSICIQILIKSSNPSVQELALNLLAFLLPSSPNAIEQMLLPPSSTKEGGNQLAKSFDSEPEKKQININKGFDHLKYMTAGKPDDSKAKSKLTKKVADKSLDASCLSYMLSVALLQKNRHLLLAGCADVIISMLTSHPTDYCEPIASTSTCQLPALDEQSTSTTTQKSTKKDYSLQQQPPAPLPVNPLANKIIEWAGLKILLKFLYRYQKISHRSESDSLMRDSVSAALRLKEEYLYTHQRVFIAVCSLIAGSPAVAAYANSLSGAEELLRISATVHEPLNNQLEMLVEAAFYALKIDIKLRKSSLEEESAAVSTLKTRRQSVITTGTAVAGSVAGEVTPGKSVSAPTISGAIVKERRTQSIQLMPRINMNFTGEYEVNTDNSRLYKEKKHPHAGKFDGPIKYQPNSDILISNSLNSIDKHTNKPIVATPVILQDYKSYQELQSRGAADELQGEHSIIDAGFEYSTEVSHEASYSPSQQRAVDADRDESKFKSRGSVVIVAPATNGTPAKPVSSTPGAHRDFFGQLPAIPRLPERIEPASVIDQHEDMRQIREKFAALAAEAIRQITDKGGYTFFFGLEFFRTQKIILFFVCTGYMRNGKGSVSIPERARRVYSPTKTPGVRVDESRSQAGTGSYPPPSPPPFLHTF